ncbi:MAG: hypothetical protein DRP93_02785 [Candidatus Neomarinimicrobiota bacterium]|nr:hypothetical protein [Candidatus Neomarinimicrobiota bacterium]RKY55750.1 MAG: hypothetical protein DRP93_02785 [Candidatus Neomarinimicrobiota bacterium]
MKFWNFVLNCLIVGVIAFAAGLLVNFLFNVIVHGSAIVAWGATFRIAVVLGLVIPLADLLKIKSD